MENYQIEQRIQIDFAYQGNPPRVYAKQYDNNMRVVAVDLCNGGQPYTVPEGYSVNIRLDKRDGHHVYNPALFGTGNTVFVILTRQMLTSPGELAAEIEVVQDENTLKTASLIIACAPSVVPDDAIESTDEYKTVQEIAAEVEEAAKIIKDNEAAINAIPGQIEDMTGLVEQAEAARDAAQTSQAAAAESVSAAADQAATATTKAEEAAASAASSAASEDRARQYAEQAASVTTGYKGYYTTPASLRAAYPTGENGWFAIVGRVGDDTRNTIWSWDDDENDWADTNNTIDLAEFPSWADLTGALLMPCNCIYESGTHVITHQSVKQIPGARYTIVMVPTHDYTAGDAVTVAGTAVEVHYGMSNVDVQTGAWQAGKPVQVEVSGDKLYIQGGPPALETSRIYGSGATIPTKATDILAPSWEGKTTVTGTPSPDNPATITGAPFAATATGPNGESRSVDLDFTGYSLPDGTKDTYDGVRGDFIQRVRKKVFDGTEEWGYDGSVFYFYIPDAPEQHVYSTHFIMGNPRNTDYTIFLNSINYLTVSYSSLNGNIESFRAWIASQYSAGTPFTIYYSLVEPIANNRKADITAFEGQATVTGADAVEVIEGRVYRFGDLAPWEVKPFSNAGSHNSIYRGMYLCDHVTDAQYAAITAGTFDDLYIGDYWIINGVTWRIAAFDYYLRCGDTDLTTHHVVIVPDSNLYNAKMNETNTTEGGYVGSAMYKTGLEQAKTAIKAAFPGHILNHRVYLTNAVTNGKPSAGAWCDSEVELMNEQMVYGGAIFMPGCDGTTVPANYRVEKSQLPLFAHRPDLISNRLTFWLRDVVTASRFAFVTSGGGATSNAASNSNGVRPAFCIYGGEQ